MRTLCAHLTPYSSIHQTGEAETLLKRFDEECLAAQRAAARAGAGLAAAAPPAGATACTTPPLRCATPFFCVSFWLETHTACALIIAIAPAASGLRLLRWRRAPAT